MSDLTPAVPRLCNPGCAARVTSIAVKYAALASLCLAVPNPKK